MKNIFKKKNKVSPGSPIVKESQKSLFTIDDVDYKIDLDTSVEIQSIVSDVDVYGWVIEIQYDWGYIHI